MKPTVEGTCAPPTTTTTTMIPPQRCTFITTSGNTGSGNGQFVFAAARSRGALDATLCREGDHWTLGYTGFTGRLRDMKGLHYLVYLLEHPSTRSMSSTS